nr:MAG: ORF1 [TTV-like mini virus]
MPYYWGPYWRRRRRRIWRRRARNPFRRRRFWRRKRHWVRKRKLKKVTIKQWNPTKVNKLKISGFYPLFEGTNLRIGNDNTQYIDAPAPYLVPGGGLYSITVFTLKGLYELHRKARNWWSRSNCNMPLMKYLGCKIILYRSYEVDSVTLGIRCNPMSATEHLYHSCQPSLLLLNKKHKLLRCIKNAPNKRQTKVIRLAPPAPMTNKWYFQRDLVDIPLAMIISSAISTDRYFSPANSISNTIGFKCLNTTLFQYHDFKKRLTTPYKPNDEFFLFTHIGRTTELKQTPVKSLVLLGNTEDRTPGEAINNTPVDTYFTTKTKWGNPFYPSIFSQDAQPLLIAKGDLTSIKQKIKENIDKNISDLGIITETTKSTYIDCRYNPQADLGHNALFWSNLQTDHHKWETPKEEKVTTQGLPLWLLTFGWADWTEKAQLIQHKDTDYCLTIVSDYIQPKLDYYVPLDYNFIAGRSPYEVTDHVKPYDQQNWHPKFNFQQETTAHIINTGPGTVKLPDKITAEAHMKYCFYFKIGGCPPPMDDVCDPQKQPTFPTPDNILSSTLLQNPEYPPQYYLYSFDQRRDWLTKRAEKRIKKDTDFTETFFKPTGQSHLSIKAPTTSSSETEESETEEESEKTLEFQLHRQQRKQRKLRKRILDLLSLLQK